MPYKHIKAQTKEQRVKLEELFKQCYDEQEYPDQDKEHVFISNGGLTLRIYLEKPTKRKYYLFCEFIGNIGGFTYDPLKEEDITDYDKMISFLENLKL